MLCSRYGTPGGVVNVTLVFIKLIVRPKADAAAENMSISSCLSSSVWATRSASSAYNNSRTSVWKVLDRALNLLRLNTLPVVLNRSSTPVSQSWKAYEYTTAKYIENSVGAGISPYLTPLSTAISSESSPLKVTRAFILRCSSLSMWVEVGRRKSLLRIFHRASLWQCQRPWLCLQRNILFQTFLLQMSCRDHENNTSSWMTFTLRFW